MNTYRKRWVDEHGQLHEMDIHEFLTRRDTELDHEAFRYASSRPHPTREEAFSSYQAGVFAERARAAGLVASADLWREHRVITFNRLVELIRDADRARAWSRDWDANGSPVG